LLVSSPLVLQLLASNLLLELLHRPLLELLLELLHRPLLELLLELLHHLLLELRHLLELHLVEAPCLLCELLLHRPFFL
jgi:hypothetical protein